ncbi:MAG: Rossmann-like domain-containing protein [Gammaproteobacteria bacterium]
MTGPHEIYDLLLDYASSPACVEELSIGLVWTLCRSGGSAGLAMSPGMHTRTLPWAGTLAGQPLRQLTGWIKEWEPYKATVGMAAVNCALNGLKPPPQGVVLESQDGAANLAVFSYFLPRLLDRKVVVIGHYPGIEKLTDTLDLTVLERQPADGDYPDPAAEFLLPKADWVFLTGSSLINKTFPRLAELAQHATTVLMGPSVPWLPEFHRFGVDYLAGVEIADAPKLQQTVSEGGGVRIFEQAVRYRIVELQTQTNMQWLKEQIAADYAEKHRLTQAMDSWYGSGKCVRFPDYPALEAVTARLSRLDSGYKRLWDAQQAGPAE